MSLTAIVLLCTLQTADAAAAVEYLRCEYRVEPLGVETARPRLCWEIHDSRRGARQTAYQILAASSPEILAAGQGDLWDSGKIDSDQSIHVVYAGKPLKSRMLCHWKVRTWNEKGQPSPWSRPARWGMGLLDQADWQAKWIHLSDKLDPAVPLPIFRREFDAAKPVRRAELFACGLGFHEVRLNGKKVGENEIDPGWTNYRRSCLYSVYDVTGQIAQGRNAIGVMLGNGMYNVVGGRYVKFKGSFGPPKLILQLHVDFADGTSSVVVSDGSWKAAEGPIRFSCIFGGEDYDARKEPAGWDRPGFDDSAWQTARECSGPGGKLVSSSAPPSKIMKEFKPVRITRPKPGVFVYDLGQNHSGFPQLTVQGPAGATVKMIPGELLETDGRVSQQQSGTPVWFAYTLRGGGREVWRPRFTYYGYRYVQIEGAAVENITESSAQNGSEATPQPPSPPAPLPKGEGSNVTPAPLPKGEGSKSGIPSALPRIVDLTGQFVHNSAETVGSFACSNPKVNQVHHIITSALLSNFQSVLTDCPHREKLGWLECSHLLAGCLMYNYDVPAFYAKICDDMQQAQTPDGLVPDIAPEYTVFPGGFRDSPEWGSAYVIAPWRVYQMYGDAAILAKHYEGMKKYVAYLGGKSKDRIVSHGLGDWADYGPNPPGESQLTSRGLTATAIYWQNLSVLEKTARLLNKSDDAERFAKLAGEVQTAFNRKFFHADANRYDRNSQTANAMPLTLGLAVEDRRAAVLNNLVDVIRANGNRVTAGDVGFMYLVRALSDAGRDDVLYDMVCQETGPGYMFQLKKGATTMTETWDCYSKWSQNHCMLGHAEEWFYRGLGGICPDPAGPGFKRFAIAPRVVGKLTAAAVSYRTMYGKIVSDWKRQGETLTLHATVPVNTTATIHVPARDAAKVFEGDRPAAEVEGVKYIRMERDAAVYEVAPGSYRFSSSM